MNEEPIRAQLGDFSSIVCFKAVVVGVEKALGHRAAAVALKAAGRARGHQLAAELGLEGSAPSPEEAQAVLNRVLGVDGTRLCVVDRVERDGEMYRVWTKETICSAGEPDGSDRQCSYTLGAIHGAVESIYGTRLRGKHTDCVLRGGTHDVMEFIPR